MFSLIFLIVVTIFFFYPSFILFKEDKEYSSSILLFSLGVVFSAVFIVSTVYDTVHSPAVSNSWKVKIGDEYECEPNRLKILQLENSCNIMKGTFHVYFSRHGKVSLHGWYAECQPINKNIGLIVNKKLALKKLRYIPFSKKVYNLLY